MACEAAGREVGGKRVGVEELEIPDGGTEVFAGVVAVNGVERESGFAVLVFGPTPADLQTGPLVGQLIDGRVFEIELGVGHVGPARGLAGEVEGVAYGKQTEAFFVGEVAVVGGEALIHLQGGEAVVPLEKGVILAIGPCLVDNDFGGGRVFADGGDELIQVGLEGVALVALVADLLEGYDFPVGGGQRLDDRDVVLLAGLGVGETFVGTTGFVAGLGFGEVAGVAFERAAADTGAAEDEFFAGVFSDLREERGGVVGEAVADGEQFEGLAFGGGGVRGENQRDGEDERREE